MDLKAAEYGDLLEVAGNIYRIIRIMPDGTGWLKLDLELQDSQARK